MNPGGRQDTAGRDVYLTYSLGGFVAMLTSKKKERLRAVLEGNLPGLDSLEPKGPAQSSANANKKMGAANSKSNENSGYHKTFKGAVAM